MKNVKKQKAPDGIRMIDDPAQHRLKAEACQRLADMYEDTKNKALWTKRARHWEQLAIETEKQLRPRTDK